MYITAQGWASFRKDETSRACNNQERACLFLPGRENNWIIEAAWTVTFHLSHIFDLHILSYIVHSNDENFTNVFSVFKRKRSLLNQVVLGLGPNSALNLFLPLHPQQVQVAALRYLPKGSTAQERASLGRKESCTAVALSAPVAYPAMKNAEVTLLLHCSTVQGTSCKAGGRRPVDPLLYKVFMDLHYQETAFFVTLSHPSAL